MQLTINGTFWELQKGNRIIRVLVIQKVSHDYCISEWEYESKGSFSLPSTIGGRSGEDCLGSTEPVVE